MQPGPSAGSHTALMASRNPRLSSQQQSSSAKVLAEPLHPATTSSPAERGPAPASVSSTGRDAWLWRGRSPPGWLSLRHLLSGLSHRQTPGQLEAAPRSQISLASGIQTAVMPSEDGSSSTASFSSSQAMQISQAEAMQQLNPDGQPLAAAAAASGPGSSIAADSSPAALSSSAPHMPEGAVSPLATALAPALGTVSSSSPGVASDMIAGSAIGLSAASGAATSIPADAASPAASASWWDFAEERQDLYGHLLQHLCCPARPPDQLAACSQKLLKAPNTGHSKRASLPGSHRQVQADL